MIHPSTPEKTRTEATLEELIREGTRRFLRSAIEQKGTEYLGPFQERKDDEGYRMVNTANTTHG